MYVQVLVAHLIPWDKSPLRPTETSVHWPVHTTPGQLYVLHTRKQTSVTSQPLMCAGDFRRRCTLHGVVGLNRALISFDVNACSNPSVCGIRNEDPTVHHDYTEILNTLRWKPFSLATRIWTVSPRVDSSSIGCLKSVMSLKVQRKSTTLSFSFLIGATCM